MRFPPTRQQAAPQTESLTALGRFIRFSSTWDWVLGSEAVLCVWYAAIAGRGEERRTDKEGLVSLRPSRRSYWCARTEPGRARHGACVVFRE